MSLTKVKALIVEDDHSWQQILEEILVECELEIIITNSLSNAISELQNNEFRLAVVDLSLSPQDHNNIDGLKVLEVIHSQESNCLPILLTGFATVELAVSAITEYSAFTFLRKENFNRRQFKDIIYRALASSSPQFSPIPDVMAENFNTATENVSLKPDSNYNSVKKAIIVEDDAGWRNILEELLSDSGYHVQVCSGFGEALGYLRREKYRLAVVDLSLTETRPDLIAPDLLDEHLDGYQLLSSTRELEIPTIVVSGVTSTDYIKKAYSEESIFAFLEKQSFNRSTFLRIIEDAEKQNKSSDELSSLTDRERDVFNLLAQGLTNKEIAKNLVITTNTVKRHIKAIFGKLDVHTRASVAAKALGEK